MKIKYTTDGSNPKEYGGVYENEFILPQSANYLQFVAEFEGEYFDNQSIKVEKKKNLIQKLIK